MNKVLTTLCLTALLTASPATALESTAATRAVMQYDVAARSFAVGDIATGGEYVNFSYNASRPHDYEVIDHRLVLSIAFTHHLELGSNGEWNVTVYQDGTPLTGCQYITPTSNPGGFLSGDLPVYPHFGLHCIRTGATELNNQDHNNTITVEYQVGEGSPDPITDSIISIGIQRRDIYMIPQDQNELLETTQALFPLLAFIAFSAWAYRTRSPITYVGATTLGLTAVVSAYDNFGPIGTTALAAALIIVIGEAIVNYATGGHPESERRA